jgi:hypothetical protein
MSGRYSARVEEYFWRPLRPLGADIRGVAGSMQSGTVVVVAADILSGRLHKLGFRVFACPHIIAACNCLAERLDGAPVEALFTASVAPLVAEFDIPVEKAGKLLILQDAMRACFADYAARPAAFG